MGQNPSAKSDAYDKDRSVPSKLDVRETPSEIKRHLRRALQRK